nr:k(+) efflux antiporter 5 [Quercus suber]
MAIFEAKKKCGTLGFWYCLFAILISIGNWNCNYAARSEKEIRERFYGSLLNSSAPDSSDGSIAKMFDQVLEKDFSSS